VNADDAVLSRNEAKEPFFISVGRVEKNKGQMELLKSYLRYRRKGGDAGLKIVGRMSMLYGLRCRAFVMMHGLGSYVDFEGHRNDVRELMRKALALVVTSVTEGFGLVSAEAMLQGCIVIGHDVTGMKEQFDIGRDFTGEEIGLRYKGVQGLSDAMSDVSERPGDFVSMRECARRTVMAKYDVREMADGLERYYLKITEGKS
jgi:glycosyltransferase involved in cell wall biosynthesis